MAGRATLGLVLSRDRALQLEAALTSLLRQSSERAGLQLVVLYRASSRDFEAQYEQLARQYAGDVRVVPEVDFRRQVLEILDEGSPSGQRRQPGVTSTAAQNPGKDSEVPDLMAPEYLLFLVDDALFTRPFSLDTVVDALSAHADAFGVSLRLGRNTTECYALGRAQSLPTFEQLPNGILKYDWTRADGDFGYPLEISSSIYRRATIKSVVEGLDFGDPNSLESQMAMRSRQFARKFPAVLCAGQSLAFSNPLNRVQRTFPNRSGERPQYSTEALAARFNLGQRINVDALQGFVPSACHQEVELVFEQRVP